MQLVVLFPSCVLFHLTLQTILPTFALLFAMDLEQFEVLELVNKIRNELVNHTGIDDRTVGKLYLLSLQNVLDLIAPRHVE